MNRPHARLLLILIALLILGCQTTRPSGSGSASSDYRQEQADRQAQRELQRSDRKVRRPLDDPKRDRQDLIDQPR